MEDLKLKEIPTIEVEDLDSNPTNGDEEWNEAKEEDQQLVAGVQEDENPIEVDQGYQLTRERSKR